MFTFRVDELCSRCDVTIAGSVLAHEGVFRVSGHSILFEQVEMTCSVVRGEDVVGLCMVDAG